MRYIGIEIGGTKLQLVVGDGTCRILDRLRLTVDPARGGEGIRGQIAEAIPQLVKAHAPGAIGVGFGGPVDWLTGRICRSHQIEGWSEFDISGWLRELTGLPVQVDNDANVAALGEALYGAGKDLDPCFYITLGSGVGGGLVVNRRIYHGAKPGEAEIGHVRLDRSGSIVESRCSGWAIDKRIRNVCRENPDGALARLTGAMKRGEAAKLPDALKAGDPSAEWIMSELCQDLAFALSHVSHLFHPSVIVIGGGLSGLGEPLRAGVEELLPTFLMEAFHPGPRLVLAGLGEHAVPVGALELARAQALQPA